jgi:hypothetical protein
MKRKTVYFRSNRFIYKFILVILVLLIFCFSALPVLAAEKQKVNAGGNMVTKVESTAIGKRYYDVMWAADANFCEKVRAYADSARSDYVPSDIDFGNLKWTELGNPTRVVADVTFAGESKSRSIVRSYTTTSIDWYFDLDIFPGPVDYSALAKDPTSFTLKQEWTFNSDDVELNGLHGWKSPKPSHWCSKLKHSEEHLGCEGRYPKWRFSFFDLIEIDGKTYITASTEKYQSPDDMDLPIVILIARYVAPEKDTPLRFGSDRTMDQLEHRCYLIKTR